MQSGFCFICDKYVNKHLELAFRVDSVNPPELVTRPLMILRE